MSHPDHETPQQKPCFAVGVVAPLGYGPPGVERFVRNKLRQLFAEKRRTHRIYIHGPWAEPVFNAATDLVRDEFGGNGGGMSAGIGRGAFIDHLRSCVRTASFSDALVIFHPGGPLPSELVRLLDVCKWVKTAARVFAFAGDLVPL